jgi:predicted protein tyrosine phosphatase
MRIMPSLHVSSLSRLHETVAATRASHVVTLINMNTVVERPVSIRPDNHLFIGVSDIVEDMDGHIVPGEEHVLRLLDFVRRWDRANPLVIHCWAGISRSTAAAFITVCALDPSRDEQDLARSLRASSPSATPNARLVAIADRILERDGRMIAAIAGIGRGADAFEGAPFCIQSAIESHNHGRNL